MDETSPVEPEDDYEWEHPHSAAIDELTAQIDAHEGARRTRLFNDLVRTFDAWARFSRTFDELLRTCETREDALAALMQNIGDRTRRDSIIIALDQAIIAFAAGAGAVVDQTRNALRHQSTTLREAEAQRRKAHIEPIPGAAFLTKLRNYVLHYLAAPWEFSVEMEEDNITGKVLLTSNELNRFDGWNSSSREFIATQSDGIQLSKLVGPFLDGMVRHTNWVIEQCAVENAQLVDEVNGLVAKKNLLLTGGATDGRDWEARMTHIAENLKRSSAASRKLTSGSVSPSMSRNSCASLSPTGMISGISGGVLC